MSEETSGDFPTQAAEKTDAFNHYSQVVEGIESGRISDPHILDTYFRAAVSRFQESKTLSEKYRALVSGSMEDQVKHCVELAEARMSYARSASKEGALGENLATQHYTKAANWLRMAAARVEMSQVPGATAINRQGSTPPISPANPAGK